MYFIVPIGWIKSIFAFFYDPAQCWEGKMWVTKIVLLIQTQQKYPRVLVSERNKYHPKRTP